MTVGKENSERKPNDPDELHSGAEGRCSGRPGFRAGSFHMFTYAARAQVLDRLQTENLTVNLHNPALLPA
jgi:hypothetical protein